MSIKVYIIVDETEGLSPHSSKIQIPKSWTSKHVKDIINLFLTSYQKKFPEPALELDQLHLETTEGEKIYSNEIVSYVLSDHCDYRLKKGNYTRGGAQKIEEIDPSLLKCRNYGCNKLYKEEDNHGEACHHHISPPIFHDTMKCWSCCQDNKAYDFESFQLITGCSKGFHSSVPPVVDIAPSPNAVDPFSSAQPLKSIADFNSVNPEAPSSVNTALKSMERKSTRNLDGITAKCQRKGCQKTFNLSENIVLNGETAELAAYPCCYHSGQAIFHDAIKFWSCCPDKKCYDFESFLEVPGCSHGLHDDGVIDLE